MSDRDDAHDPPQSGVPSAAHGPGDTHGADDTHGPTNTSDPEHTRSGRYVGRRAVVLLGIVVLSFAAIRLATGLVPPPTIGLDAGGLQPCPDGDNCVLSTSDTEPHAIPPLACPQADIALLADEIAGEVPRTRIDSVTSDYAHLTSRSLVFGFVDDVELLAQDDVVHVRSASRLGRNDLGVNRDRVEQIRDRLTTSQACRG